METSGPGKEIIRSIRNGVFLNLKDLLLVALKAVQFQVEVPEIPQSNSSVSRAGGEDVG